jgi:hypothetical protein
MEAVRPVENDDLSNQDEIINQNIEQNEDSKVEEEQIND